MSVDLVEKLAEDELHDVDVDGFINQLAQDAHSQAFVSPSRDIWRQERKFSIPQPSIASRRFKLFSADASVKRISTRFNKRILIRPRVCSDELLLNSASLRESDLYASLPFGFHLLQNKTSS